MKVSRQRVVDLMRKMDYPQVADIAERELPDPVDMDQVEAFGVQHGLSRDDLISRMGGSP